MSDVADLMKRCQRGVGGRNALDEAHDIMADCYGTLGKLEAERDKLAGLLRESLATHKMWADLAPALSLCADIEAALAEVE